LALKLWCSIRKPKGTEMKSVWLLLCDVVPGKIWPRKDTKPTPFFKNFIKGFDSIRGSKENMDSLEIYNHAQALPKYIVEISLFSVFQVQNDDEFHNLSSEGMENGIPFVKDVTIEFLNNIQHVLNKTCLSQFIGIGRDSHGLKHKGFEVLKVERIHNQSLWRNYIHKRDTLNSNKEREFINVETSDQWMETLLHPQANEVLLYQGTKSEIVDLIIKQGFEERIAKDKGIFGAGIYFAENISKSDEYITPDHDGLCKVFLSRVCLGTPFVTLEPLQSIRRPPCREGDNVPCHHERADSVLAECRRTGFQNAALERYREFIIYDRVQCYPEFLITFKRVFVENP